MYSVSSNDARQVEVVRADGVSRRTDYIGSPGIIDEHPQAFYVDRLYPGARIDPHFHDIDQFQVVVDGDCMMGKKHALPVTFQYADAYTPYGPIVGDQQGFGFFTLRPIASGGFFAMPGNRHNMPGRAGRNIAGRFETESARPAAGDVCIEDLMPDQSDEVRAVGIRLGPNAATKGIAGDGGGQYYLVCEGALIEKGKRLPTRSLMHIAPHDPVPELRAGPDGADVLVLQFARPSERPGSDPAVLATRDPAAYRQRPDRPS